MYDYRCERCTTQFEVRQSFSDGTLTVCPPEGGPSSCVAPGEGPVKKVFSGVAISFKGDGFYKNDHGANAKGRRTEKTEKDDASAKRSSSADSSSNGSSSAAEGSPAKDSSPSTASVSSSGSGSESGRSKADAGASSSSSS